MVVRFLRFCSLFETGRFEAVAASVVAAFSGTLALTPTAPPAERGGAGRGRESLVLALICLLIADGTLFISLATAPNRTDDQLRGLVYSLTEKQTDVPGSAWYARPMPLALVVLAATLVLNIIFW